MNNLKWLVWLQMVTSSAKPFITDTVERILLVGQTTLERRAPSHLLWT
ncbi:MAG: hypothetical protein NZ741_01380 [Armatimonadetes bacterium]|nr:hypothetical protein [Armatimonadota bacterium]